MYFVRVMTKVFYFYFQKYLIIPNFTKSINLNKLTNLSLCIESHRVRHWQPWRRHPSHRVLGNHSGSEAETEKIHLPFLRSVSLFFV